MATSRNSSNHTRIAVCPALRPPEAATGREGCGKRFDEGESTGSARRTHFAKHDPEDFGLTPIQTDGGDTR